MTSFRKIFGLLLVLVVAGFGLFVFQQWRTPPSPPPASSEELIQRGLQGIRTRDLEEVRAAVIGLDSRHESAEELPLLRGALSLYTENPSGALLEFAKLNPEGRLRDPLLTLTGEALYRVGRLDDAEGCLKQAIADGPDSVDALRWLATVVYDLGDIDQTLQVLAEVSRLAPDDFRPHHMQGIIYRDFGVPQQAVVQLGRATELAPAGQVRDEMRSLLASAQMSLKQFETALRTLQECQKTTATLTMQADCHWQLGQLDEARVTLSQAESLGQLPPTGKRLKARIAMERQDLDEAQRILEALIVVDPNDDEAEYLFALVCRQRRDDSGYQSHFQRSESIKTAKNQLTELSQKAMREPTNAEVRDQLGALCDRLGMKPLAEVWRTAAASCRRRQAVVSPSNEATP